MKKTTLLAFSLVSVMAATIARADFVDYFNMDAGTVLGNASATPGPSTLIGDPSAPKYGGQWRLDAIGSILNPNPTVAFQRSPASLSIPAIGFTLSAPAHSTVQLWIPGASILDYNVRFNWSVNLKPGSIVTIDGLANIVSWNTPGLFSAFNVPGFIQNNAPVGFLFELKTGNSADILQIVGWDTEAIPEPGTLAMGAVTLLGVGAIARRRYLSKK